MTDSIRVPSAIQFLRVPRRVDAALRALIAIDAADGQPVKGHDIAYAEQISRAFLSTILTDMCKRNLLCSMRGAAGGYWLARSAAEITVANVYAAVDLRTPSETPGSPVSSALWNLAEGEITNILDRLSVADLRSWATVDGGSDDA